jgi:DNA-binding LacI/PurR family transcriptional regulator
VVALEVSPPGMPFVRFDTERGTELAIRHLLELGHTRIGHLGSELDAETFRLRREALTSVLGEAGLEPGPYARAPFRFEAARAAALELLDSAAPMTAVYCDDDLLAGGVYLAARDRGLGIPDGLSVVGFDDLPFAQVFEPPLTTVRIDPEALGSESFEVLAALMAGESQPPGRILPVELVVRASTGPPA